MTDTTYFSIFPNQRFLELTIYQFGYEKCRPNHSFGPASRNHYLFHYIVSGKGLLISSEDKDNISKHYTVTQGQGFMFYPGQINTYIADSEDPWTYAWIEFDGLQARELLLKAGYSYNHPIYTDKNPAKREQMVEELMYIITHADNPPLELMGHFYLFMHHLIESSAGSHAHNGGSIRDFYVREAMTYIEMHYHKDISVQDIADYCNLHRSYLNRIFKIVMDVTPQQFIIMFRIKKACELLKIDKRPIGEVCVMVGYPDQLSFSRAFKRQMGVSPQTWRKENRGL